MKILVTGGAGFVGSNLTNALVQDSSNYVVVTGNKTEANPSGNVKVLTTHLNGLDWPFLNGIDVVFHQAADNDTQSKDYREMFKANTWSAIDLFERMYKQGCRKFVFASSTAIYGDNPAPYCENSSIKPNPLTFYAESKLEFEKWAFDWASNNDASVIGLRYCNVYGPGECHKGKRASMIYQLVKQMKEGNSPKIFKNGEQKRDWIYVKDVVEANLLALDYVSKGNSGVFNMGTGVATAFNDIVEIISEALVDQGFLIEGFKPEYINCPFMDSFQGHTECDMKKAETQLGFRSKWNIKNGIKDFINYV